jgi:hypothetical protein
MAIRNYWAQFKESVVRKALLDHMPPPDQFVTLVHNFIADQSYGVSVTIQECWLTPLSEEVPQQEHSILSNYSFVPQ